MVLLIAGCCFWLVALPLSMGISATVGDRHASKPHDGKLLVELAYMLPGVVWAVGPNIVHLIAVQTRPHTAYCEILGFGTWWFIVLLLNVRYPNSVMERNITTFLLQFGIMFYLRSNVY